MNRTAIPTVTHHHHPHPHPHPHTHLQHQHHHQLPQGVLRATTTNGTNGIVVPMMGNVTTATPVLAYNHAANIANTSAPFEARAKVGNSSANISTHIKAEKGKVQTKEIVELYANFRYMKDAIEILNKSVQKMNRAHRDDGNDYQAMFAKCLSSELDRYNVMEKESTNKKRKVQKKGKHERGTKTSKSHTRKTKAKTVTQQKNKEKSQDDNKELNQKNPKPMEISEPTRADALALATTAPAKDLESPQNLLSSELKLRLEKDASARRSHTRQLLRCTSYLREQLAECEKLIDANYPERRLATIAVKASLNVEDMLSPKRYQIESKLSGSGVSRDTENNGDGLTENGNGAANDTLIVDGELTMIAGNQNDGAESATSFPTLNNPRTTSPLQQLTRTEPKYLVPIPKPTPVKNKPLQFTPIEAIRIIATNNLQESDCITIIDAWIKRAYIPIQRDAFIELVEKYYYGGGTINTSWDELLAVPLLVPIDSKWTLEDKQRCKDAIEDVKGVTPVEVEDVATMIHRDRRNQGGHSTSTSYSEDNTDFVEDWIAQYTNTLEANIPSTRTNNSSSTGATATGLDALAASASIALPLAQAMGGISNNNNTLITDEITTGTFDAPLVPECEQQQNESTAVTPGQISVITQCEARSHPRYKVMFMHDKILELSPNQIPGPVAGKNRFEPLEAISLYMQLEESKRGDIVRHWNQHKFIPMDSGCFEEICAAFMNNKPIPVHWVDNWKAVVRECTDEELKKKIDATMRYVREGTVPVPPYPRREFTPLEVAIILSSVKSRDKTPIIEVWTRCGFVPVGRKSLTTVARKYQQGESLPSRFGMYGRSRLNGTEKKCRKRKPGEMVASVVQKRKEPSKCGVAARAKQKSKKEKLIEETGVPLPPDGKTCFTPLEAVTTLDSIHKDIRRFVAEQWIERKYIPVKRTALYNHYRAYKSGKDPPKEWNSNGRPPIVDMEDLVKWAKQTSKQKGCHITEDEMRTKLASYGGSVSRKSIKTYWACIKTTLDMDSTIPAAPRIPRVNNEPTVPINVQENTNHLLQMHQMFGYHEDISHDDVNSFL